MRALVTGGAGFIGLPGHANLEQGAAQAMEFPRMTIRDTSTYRPRHLAAVGLGFLVVLSIPLFFDMYRTLAFNTAPHDDYAPYLLWLVGARDNPPTFPIAYRVLSVAAAVPLYFILPTYEFTNLTGVDPAYLRACEALAAVSWICILANAVVVFAIARKALGSSAPSAAIAGLLSLQLMGFASREGVDPFAILVISALVLFLDQSLAWTVLLVLGAFVNEKIPMIFVFLFGLRYVFEKPHRATPQLIVSSLVMVGYFVVIGLVRAPGNEYLTRPFGYPALFLQAFGYFASLKGVVTNGVPIAVVAVLAALTWKAVGELGLPPTRVRRSDCLVWVLLLVVAMLINMQFTIGRLVVFAFPLYLPVLALYLDRWFPHAGRV